MTREEFKYDFVQLIEARLLELQDQLHTVKMSTNTKFNQRRIEWIMSLIRVNEDWKGRLEYGRYWNGVNHGQHRQNA